MLHQQGVDVCTSGGRYQYWVKFKVDTKAAITKVKVQFTQRVCICLHEGFCTQGLKRYAATQHGDCCLELFIFRWVNCMVQWGELNATVRTHSNQLKHVTLLLCVNTTGVNINNGNKTLRAMLRVLALIVKCKDSRGLEGGDWKVCHHVGRPDSEI